MTVDWTGVPSFGIQYMHGSFEGPEPPTHCRDCGRPMRLYETQGERLASEPRFNADGTPNMVRHARCSAPWPISLFGFHDHAVQDAHGDWPWGG